MSGKATKTPRYYVNLSYMAGLGWPYGFREPYQDLIERCICQEWQELSAQAVEKALTHKYNENHLMNGHDFLFLNKLVVRRVEVELMTNGETGRLFHKDTTREHHIIARALRTIYRVS